MVHFFVPLIGIGGVLYIFLCFLLFVIQGKLIFYPNAGGRELQASPEDIGLDYESVFINTSDNISLHGWYIKAEKERGTLLFFHGNAGNISHRLDSLMIFNNLGLSTLIIDYRGYGQSQGRITEEGAYFDAEAAWQHLVNQKGTDAKKIVIFGRSLGGAVAADLAVKHPPAALILESAFSSVPDMAARLYPFFPVRLLCRYRFDTRRALESISSPVLIIHSPNDEIIPFENGRILFESAREPKSFLEINGGHNDGFLVSGQAYFKALNSFVSTCLM